METIKAYFGNIAFDAYEEKGEVFFPLDPIDNSLTGVGAYRASWFGPINTEYYANKFKESDDYRISSILRRSLRVIGNDECLPIVPFAIWLLFYFDFRLYERNYIVYIGYIQDLLAQYTDLPGRIEAFIDAELKKIENEQSCKGVKTENASEQQSKIDYSEPFWWH